MKITVNAGCAQANARSYQKNESGWNVCKTGGLVDTFRAANPDCNDHFHGLITVPVVLMKTEAFASIYCWPVNHWRLVVLLQVLIMQSVGWKTIRPRAGLVRILTLMSAPCLNTGPPLKRIKHIYPSLGKFIHNQVNTK